MRNHSSRNTSVQAFGSLILLLAAGCSPVISTNLQKSYSARTKGSSVVVYDIGEETPSSAEVLGNVRVDDPGSTSEYSYGQVLRIAREAVNKAGGNSLALTYRRQPGTRSSTRHHISGNILLLPDSLAFPDYQPPFDPIDIRHNIPDNTPKGPWKGTIFFNAGYSAIATKIVLPIESFGDPRSGVDFNTGFSYVSSSGFGAGLRYSLYAGSFQYTDDLFRTIRNNIRIHYIGPEFVMRQKHKRWTFHENFGYGYGRYTESDGDLHCSLGGFGGSFSAGVEYRLTRHIGIGAEIDVLAVRFGFNDVALLAEDSGFRIMPVVVRISASGGIRVYF